MVQLGITSRRQVYLFIGFLFKNANYDGNAHQMWEGLQEFQVEYEAIKIIFENKKYHLVSLKNIKSSLETFTENKLNAKDPTKTLYIHPHAMKRKLQQGDFVKFIEDNIVQFGVIKKMYEEIGQVTILKYIKDIDSYLL